MTRSMDIQRLWDDIEAEIAQSSVSLQDMKLLGSGAESPWGEILLGVDSKGRRHLVVPAPADATEEREDSSRGISIEIRPYLSGGTRRLYCDVSCRLEELNEMFTVIAEDMLTELRDRDFDSPFSACVRVLERWRRLLERVPTRLMSRNAQAGLVAELLFLRRLAGRSPKWIDLWVGPEGGRHDFVSKETDVEVKASLSEEQRKVHVQSLQQLDIAEGAALYLYFVRLREPTGQGISIPDLVEELLVRGINSGELHDRLLQVGYSPLDRDAYQTTRFEVLEESAFRVDADAFPRLTPDSLRGSLPKGVVSLGYDIDLDLAGVQPLDATERARVIEEMTR